MYANKLEGLYLGHKVAQIPTTVAEPIITGNRKFLSSDWPRLTARPDAWGCMLKILPSNVFRQDVAQCHRYSCASRERALSPIVSRLSGPDRRTSGVLEAAIPKLQIQSYSQSRLDQDA